MIFGIEHHFISLYATCDMCLFKSFAHFPAGLFAFLLLNIKNSSCILDSSSLLDMCFLNSFS